MPTRETESVGVSTAAKEVADHAKTLVGLELELASLELKQKLASFGLGLGLAVAGALFGLFALGFLLATVAAALATFLATWLALLIVAASLILLAGGLVLVGLKRLKSGVPPVPEQAIREAKLTGEAIRSNGNP